MEHLIKIKDYYYEPIVDGRKTFEVRRNDRGYNAGDTLRFIVISYDENNKEILTETDQRYLITYVYIGELTYEGMCIFSILPVDENKEETKT